jgi:hypothetical protein
MCLKEIWFKFVEWIDEAQNKPTFQCWILVNPVMNPRCL